MFDPDNFDDYDYESNILQVKSFFSIALVVVVAIALFIVIAFIAGCAGTQEIKALTNSSERIAQMQMQAVTVQRETFVLKCGNNKDACRGLSFSYTDPRDRQKVTGNKVNGTNDVIIGVAPSVVSVVGWVAGAVATTRIVDDVMAGAGGSNTTTHNTTSVVGDNNQTTASTTVSKSESNNNPATDNSRDSSNNSQQNATATPTIVEQPSPVIVTQPAPVIVNPVVVP